MPAWFTMLIEMINKSLGLVIGEHQPFSVDRCTKVFYFLVIILNQNYNSTASLQVSIFNNPGT